VLDAVLTFLNAKTAFENAPALCLLVFLFFIIAFFVGYRILYFNYKKKVMNTPFFIFVENIS